MRMPEPPPGRWEIHWRMLGADFRIRPLFWVSCVLLGVIYYHDPKVGGVGPFFFWMATALVSLLFHDMGHVLAARLCGARVRVVLAGLGGQVFGTDALRRWQRILIALAGPVASMLLFGIVWGIFPFLPTAAQFTTLRFQFNAILIFLLLNALWAFLNVLPLWPLDGGHAAVEIGEAVLGRRGRTLALLISLAVSLLVLTRWVVLWMRVTLINRFDPHYPLYLGYFCIQLLYCYAFWLSAFRALWGESIHSDDETGKPDQAA